MTKTTLHICVTCKSGETLPGQALHRAMQAHGSKMLNIVPVECLCVCKRPCTVAVSAPRKWSYVIGDLSAEDIPALLDYAAAYAASPTGTPPLSERPPAVRRGTLARVPPLATE